MKPLKLSIALVMSFAAMLAASGYADNAGKNTDIHFLSATQFESMYSIVTDEALLINAIIVLGTANTDGGDDDTKACDDLMDDLCDN